MNGIVHPFASVIVPVKNDAKKLALCLAALGEQTYPADRFEVLVCDSESTDDPRQSLLSCPQARMLSCGAHAGRAAARNRGLRFAQGEVIAFTDADCIPDRHWLEKGIGVLLSSPERSVIGGRILVQPHDAKHPTVMEAYDMIVNFRQEHYLRAYRFCATANMFVRTSAASDIGPFDETLFDGYGGEDRDWGLRAHAAECSLLYAPSVLVTHPAQRSIVTFLRKYAMIVESAHLIRRKHGIVGPGRSLIKRIFHADSRLRLLLSSSRGHSPVMMIGLLGLHALECSVHVCVSVIGSLRFR